MSTPTEPRNRTRTGLHTRLLGLRRNRLLRSLGRALLVSFGVMIVTFTLIRLIPGDPVEILLGDQATDELVEEYRKILGLDGTFAEQFIGYIGDVLQGDLGTSVYTRQSVSSTLKRALPTTAWLIAVTLVMALVMAVPLGVIAAIYRGTWFDHLFRVVSSALLAMPGFYLGLLFLLFFSIRLGLAPVAGYVPSFPENLHYLWLPALTICAVLVPILARVLQSSIVDSLEQEYVETAIVRGLPTRTRVWRYLLRPSLAPTIGLLGYMTGQMLGAAVVIEIVFNIPGIGTALVVEGVLLRDYTLVQGIVLVFGLLVVAISFVSETLSEWLDPRIKTS
jgi:peptide/nickel transport system permease protein